MTVSDNTMRAKLSCLDCSIQDSSCFVAYTQVLQQDGKVAENRMEGWVDNGTKVAELISPVKYTGSLQDNSLVCNEIMLVTLQQDFDLRSEFAGEVRLFHVYYQ